MTQHGPRTEDAVMAARYWITDAGYAALAAAEAATPSPDPQSLDATRPHDLDDDPDHDPPCCPTPQAAARNLCGCWGMGAGQWIGSAS